MSMTSLISRKLSDLIDVIEDLRGQLRAAVATELSKAIATTVREILEVLIAKRELPKWEKPVGDYGRAGNGFDDWDDPSHPCRLPQGYVEVEEPRMHSGEPVSSTIPPVSVASLTLAVNAGHWLYRLSKSWLCGLGGLLAVGLAASYGGPLTRSLIAVAATVQQLAGHGDNPLSIPD